MLPGRCRLRALRGADSPVQVREFLVSLTQQPAPAHEVDLRALRRRTQSLIQALQPLDGSEHALPDDLRAELDYLQRLLDRVLSR